MDLQLTDKAAIVTGGSMGIGRAVAEGLAAEGCDVAIVARGRELLEQVAAEISEASGRRCLPLVGDMSSTDDAYRVVNAAGALSVERSGLCPPGFQRALLEAEGVPFDGKGRVRLAVCVFEPDPADLDLGDPADLDLGDPAPAHQEATPCTVA